jgi:cyclophilin family peptidyl-prolyl cis-trans isomerase
LHVVFRHFPLSFHDKAAITAEAAEAAGDQGMFWEMHDLIFERQRQWAGQTPDAMVEVLIGYAQELDLDIERFSRDLNEGTNRDLVQQRFNEAAALGLPGTPTVFINGQYIDLGQASEGLFVGLIEFHNYDGPQYAAPPPMVIDPSQPYLATVMTTQGSFCIELFASQAPQTVNSFVFLAREGFFDGASFHRVLPGFVAQTGDPTGSGFGGPGYRFDDEIVPDLVHDGPGIVSMANSGPNTNGSQFFITYDALPSLDGKHTVFGRVLESMDVVESLQPRDPQQNPYAPADFIETILIGSKCGL